MLRILIVVHVLVVLLCPVLMILLLVLHLAFKEFVLVHFAEAHLRVVLVRVLVAVLHDLIIVARRHAINLNNLHEHTSEFEFLAALQEECVRLLLCFGAGWGRCLTSARPRRLMHYASIIAALRSADSCAVVGAICTCIVIASITLSATVSDVSGRVSSLTSVLII